jgi:hypothetical protein
MTTAARFLELFFAQGGDYYLRHDGRVVLRGSAQLLDAVRQKVAQIGRAALVAELRQQIAESDARLAAILPHRQDVAP